MYYYPNPSQNDNTTIAQDLAEIAQAGIRSIWLFFDPFYDRQETDRLRWLFDEVGRLALEIVPVLGLFLHLEDHPEVKIVNADGTTSDDPRFWNMGCFNHPTVLELATARAAVFFRDFGDHPALYRLGGRPVMSFVHEAYYRNSVPEFGGGPMLPSCYCLHCQAAFQEYLSERGLSPTTEPPRDPSDPILWQHWLNSHAQAIPNFLRNLIQAVRVETPVWATHECNDFYPASWQSVYTGNDWWRMGAELDFGHEDMYPLEFDHRYQCYVYDYAKDVMRSAVGFDKLITGNGQAFHSWAGYKLPEGSMSEQIYSCLAHGALGLVWWGAWRGQDPDSRYELLRQTRQYNTEFLDHVELLKGYELGQARVALLYSWTTMSQALTDDHTYDTLLTYMMLVQSGYPVDLVSEDQVTGGILLKRNYQTLCVMGCSALPDTVHAAIDSFVTNGGLVIADHALYLNGHFPPLYNLWRAAGTGQPRVYTLSNTVPIPVQLKAGSLAPSANAEILARFEDGSPAICRMKQGNGSIILAGSYLGWDYSNYPGYYDLAAMFPFHIRRDDMLRRWLADTLSDAGVKPPASSSHPDVEVGLWHTSDRSSYLLIAINHLRDSVTTTLHFSEPGSWTAVDAAGNLALTLAPLEGRTIQLNKVL
jgi:hypothetical protein